MENLRDLCQGRPCGFRIARSKLLPPDPTRPDHYQMIEDVRGRSLYSLMIDPEISPKLKEDLGNRYRKSIAEMKTSLKGYGARETAADPSYFAAHHPPGIEVKMDGLPALELRPFGRGNDHLLLVKSDNVIVDPVTLRMTIVDPY